EPPKDRQERPESCCGLRAKGVWRGPVRLWQIVGRPDGVKRLPKAPFPPRSGGRRGPEPGVHPVPEVGGYVKIRWSVWPPGVTSESRPGEFFVTFDSRRPPRPRP